MKDGKRTIWVRFMIVLVAVALLASGASAQKTKRKKVVTPPPPPAVTAEELKQLNQAASQSRENLITASNTYRESLERLLELQRQDERRVADLVEKRKQLLDLGIIAKKQVEESEQQLTDAKAKSAETEKQIDSVEHMVAEVNAAEELAK